MDRLDETADARQIVNRRLGAIGAVAATVRADNLATLAKLPNLTVTPDSLVEASGYSSKQLWPYESTAYKNWGLSSSSTPSIAVVDSGIQGNRTDFGGRVVANANLSTLPNNSPGDGRGHGTFVAGIAAGGAAGYVGAAPNVNIVSLDVMDDAGMARTSDVIAACQWILANKAKYNIRVANFSLHSTTPSNFTTDPLDQAVEQLWFAGVVVVAASGNYGSATGPSGVLYAPGNDPFVITVGAVDINGTTSTSDDTVPSWSAYGYTYDGFAKPEIVAPGRYMVGPVPPTSTLAIQRASNIVAPGYIQLSGTSFASAAVAGAVTQIMIKRPSLTPDQVKGILMVTAAQPKTGALSAAGVGELQAGKALSMLTMPNPNKGLDQFIKADSLAGSGKSFNAVSWSDMAKANVSWDAVSWSDVSWSNASWSAVSWSDVSWSDVSWSDLSLSAVSWSDSSAEDAVEGEANSQGGYLLTPEQALAFGVDQSNNGNGNAYGNN